MGIFKYDFNQIVPPEVVSSEYFNTTFSKQKQEFNQIYEILYNLQAQTNILNLHRELLDVNQIKYLDEILPNKSFLTFNNITQYEIDTDTLPNIYNTYPDNISGYLIARKETSISYNISNFYELNLLSSNNNYLTKPLEILYNNATINSNTLSVLFKYINDNNITSYTSSLILSFKKNTATELINTIIINPFPAYYTNYLYNITVGKNKDKIVLSNNSKTFNGGDVVFNNIDYSTVQYIPIDESYLDYIDIEYRNRTSLLTDNIRSSIIGIKNIYLESNKYSTASYYAFKLKDNLTYKSNRLTSIKLNNKSFLPFNQSQVSIRIYDNETALYSNFNTPRYNSNSTSYYAPTNKIDLSLMSDPIVVIVVVTQNSKTTPVIKNIELTWEV